MTIVRVANFRLFGVPARVYYSDQTEITHSNNAKSAMTDENSQTTHSNTSPASQDDAAAPLTASKPAIINIGLEDFARELVDQGVEVLHTSWQPPCGGDKTRADLLSRLG